MTSFKTPIWNLDDVKVKHFEGDILLYKTTHPVRPPFYEGDLPLTYEKMIGELPSIPSPERIVLSHAFDRFGNLFIYKNNAFRFRSGVPDGAITMDMDGNILAEARFLQFVEGENNVQLVEIEEFHYNNNGELIFYCKSLIDHRCFKVEEVESFGKKERDYYFVYPARWG